MGGGGGGFNSDEDDNELLSTGTYALTETSVEPATCGLTTAAFFAQFAALELEVNPFWEIDLDFEGLFQATYKVSGTGSLYNYGSPGNHEVDFHDPVVAMTDYGFETTFDCVLGTNVAWTGEITNYGEFKLTDFVHLFPLSGAECGMVATSSGLLLPCIDAENTSWRLSAAFP